MKRMYFLSLFFLTVVLLSILSYEIVGKYQEISKFSEPLGIVFLVAMLLFILTSLFAVYSYLKEIFQLGNVEELKKKIKDAIDKNDKQNLQHTVLDFIEFCETYYGDRGNIFEVKNRLKSYSDLSIDTILELLKEVENKVFTVRDEKAKEIIRSVALQTAVSTAISPIALVDAFIMFWRSWFLVKEIAKIYGFRPNLVNTMKLFRKSIQNMTISASIEVADDLLIEMGGLGSFALEKISKTLLQAFSNGILVLRFGYSVMETCRPLTLDKTRKQSIVEDFYSWFRDKFFAEFINNARERIEKSLPEPVRKPFNKVLETFRSSKGNEKITDHW